jgi:hypothetical protein
MLSIFQPKKFKNRKKLYMYSQPYMSIDIKIHAFFMSVDAPTKAIKYEPLQLPSLLMNSKTCHFMIFHMHNIHTIDYNCNTRFPN